VGTYFLVETQPLPGYTSIESDVQFTVSGMGEIVIDSPQHASWLTAAENVTGVKEYLLGVPNESAVDIALEKEISGNFGNKTETFAFNIGSLSANGSPVSGTFNYTLYQKSSISGGYYVVGTGTVTFTNGTPSYAPNGGTAGSRSVLLGHRMKIVIKDIPKHAAFTVTEADNKGYDTSYKAYSLDKSVTYYDGTSATQAAQAEHITITANTSQNSVSVSRVTSNGMLVVCENTKSMAVPTVADGGAKSAIILLGLLAFALATGRRLSIMRKNTESVINCYNRLILKKFLSKL